MGGPYKAPYTTKQTPIMTTYMTPTEPRAPSVPPAELDTWDAQHTQHDTWDTCDPFDQDTTARYSLQIDTSFW